MKIALYGKHPVNGDDQFLEHLLEVLRQRGCGVWIYKMWMQPRELAGHLNMPFQVFESCEQIKAEGIDFLLSIGGDGTLLDTLPLVHDSGIPVIGINLGRLGFLSAAGREDLYQVMDSIFQGNIHLEPRTLIQLQSNNFTPYPYALNELSILKELPASMISISVWIDGEFLNTYWADGLLIATPTGSTAYSLSCGGPIITPNSRNLLITPVANHNLTVRPVVVPDSSCIEVEVDTKSGRFVLGLDSRVGIMKKKTRMQIRLAPFTLNLGRLPSRTFYSTLRAKLTWGHDIRN
ncbi:MAG: kinase [Bacteroidales bacterium]|jgi:NAD+ kinase|nr:kinase [Bacteroidales bacterium]MDN5328523.1 kinase [Bacteroidales bacterium]